MNKTLILRKLLQGTKIIRIAGAHNGMSARLVEEAGFEGIWASGFEVSTSHAVPDANILTMTEYFQAACNMNEATSIPVIVDADTGYGNCNNVRHMVRKFETAGIAAVCIEDKKFPKVNSFVSGRQDLVSVEEFCGKIAAAKDIQRDENFCVFARVEALIAGHGLQAALHRAQNYSQAGADAIFIHSKSQNAEEIVAFAEAWKEPTPLMICPTTYPMLTVKEADYHDIKIYIFANHGVRAAIQAMEQTLRKLAQTGDIREIEKEIAPMAKVFDIQGMEQMKSCEKKYLNGKRQCYILSKSATPCLKEN